MSVVLVLGRRNRASLSISDILNTYPVAGTVRDGRTGEFIAYFRRYDGDGTVAIEGVR